MNNFIKVIFMIALSVGLFTLIWLTDNSMSSLSQKVSQSKKQGFTKNIDKEINLIKNKNKDYSISINKEITNEEEILLSLEIEKEKLRNKKLLLQKQAKL